MSVPLLPAPGRRIFFAAGKTLFQWYLTLAYRLRVSGRENLPRGPYLVVANHQSLFDPPIIGVSVPGQFHPMARATLRDVPVMGWAMANCHTIFVDQEGGGDRAAIEACIAALGRGGVVAVFPEGSRTYDGTIGPFASGAALIARRARVPVVPAAIEGAFDAWPRGRRFPRVLGQRVKLVFGSPIPADEVTSMKTAALTGLLESRVRSLHAGLASSRGS